MTQVMIDSDFQGNSLFISLLGTFRVIVGAREVPASAWRLRKASQILKLLALTPGHALHKEQICEVLWPDLAPEGAFNNMRYALHVARGILDDQTCDSSLFVMRQQTLSLHPAGPITIDVEVFEAAAQCGLREPALCHAALALYTGDLLPEDRYEAWAEGRRAQLRRTHRELQIVGAQWQENQGDLAAAITLLEQIVIDEPTHEECQFALMRLYAQIGRRSDAIAQYAQLRAALLQDLDVAPAPATIELYNTILSGRLAPTVPLAAATSSVPPKLPVPLTRFIGREHEIATVKHLLNGHRLVTLMGAGGCGKTRLALAVAAEQAAVHPAGVWFTELASLFDPTRVMQAVATSLGVREEPGRLLVLTLADALRSAPQLLVLDNCEHVIAACREFAAMLLPLCPELHMLATSREAIHVPGEVTWHVPPLSLPAPNAPVTQMLQSEAVQLFVDRVHWRQPDFALHDQIATAVAAICRRLDGLPLALELAAAKTSVLSMQELLARLDDALQLLTGGSQVVEARQQTLRATLDWSYAFLDSQERLLFARLAIFAGSCSLAAAEAICAGDGLAQADILLLLAQLVDKSLIVVDFVEGTTYYRLLETVRQYARERLQAEGNAEQLAQRHGCYYLALVEEAGRSLTSSEQAIWLERLEREDDNLRAALRFTRDAQDALAGLRFVRHLWRFWYTRGYLQEGSMWLMQFLALGRAANASDVEALLWLDALFGAGRIQYFRGDLVTARVLFEEMRTVAATVADRSHLASALTQLGNIALYASEIADATALYAEGLAIRRELGDDRTIGSSLGNLGWLALLQSDLVLAHKRFVECLPLLRHAGDQIEVMRTLTGLGLVATGMGQGDRASDLFAECLILAEKLQAKRAIADCLEGFATLAYQQGEHPRALQLTGAATALETKIGNPLPPLWQARRAEFLAIAGAMLGAAQCAELLHSGQMMPLAQAIALALMTTQRQNSPAV